MLQSTNANSALLAFVPRSVSLARKPNMKKNNRKEVTVENGFAEETLKLSKKKEKSKKKSSGNDRDSSPLLRSVAAFLEQNGFDKTLAAFRAEASIEEVDDGSKVLPLDLEMYYKYLELSKCDSKSNISGTEELGVGKDGISEKDQEESKCAAQVESTKKKRKKTKGTDAGAADELPVDVNNEVVSQLQKKSHERKNKSKLDSDSISGNLQEVGPEAIREHANNTVSEPQLDESNMKSKDKKKKKSKSSKSLAENIEQDTPVHILEDSEEKKSSKKRKRSSEENESQTDKILTKEGKQSNTVASEEVKAKDKSPKANPLAESKEHAGKKRRTENGHVDLSEKNNFEKNEKEGSAPQKSTKKQHNGSAEPKTVNAFQRVKIDKVEFADDRLQDNSYWAKDGAEVGYGAKAQEVLGQVRGRDFRHEKTKKKRGSYRGGQIDLQSHSVKFNYSDEE